MFSDISLCFYSSIPKLDTDTSITVCGQICEYRSYKIDHKTKN